MDLESIVEQLLLEKLIKIAGPAILFKPKKVIVKGIVGTSHMMLWVKLRNALAKKLNISPQRADDMIDEASEKDLVMGFITDEGKFVNREQAWKIAQTYKKNVQAMSAQGAKPEMASEYL